MSRRAQIAMSEEEVDEFLRGRHTMNVATIGPDGRVHLVAMWYGFTADDRPAFWTYGRSQKILNLQRDPSITCLVETGATYPELKGVELVTGQALGQAEKGRRGIGRRAVEKGTHHLLHRGLADLRGLGDALVDIGLVDGAVLDHTARLEPGKEGADR